MSISRWWFVLWLILLLIGQVRVQIPCSCSLVNCTWGGWSAWAACSDPCGNAGWKSRSRGISRSRSCGGSRCSGPSSQTQACNRFCYNGGTPQPGHCDCTEFWGTCCDKCKYRNTTSYYNPASVCMLCYADILYFFIMTVIYELPSYPIRWILFTSN